ncbi:magnesium transporter [Kaarinaea lacus]
MVTNELTYTINRINRTYSRLYPGEVAQLCESTSYEEAVRILQSLNIREFILVWEQLPTNTQDKLLKLFDDETIKALLTRLEPSQSATILFRLDEETRDAYLELLDKSVSDELKIIIGYAPDTAGRLMDPRIFPFQREMTVEEAQQRLRKHKPKALRELYLIDNNAKLCGKVDIQNLVIAEPEQLLGDLSTKQVTSVQDIAPREEVLEIIENRKLLSLPVVDFEGRFIGVIRAPALMSAVQEETSLDIQTMVGVSKDENALSSVSFSVVKRLPWLHINLATAFIAAAVVGLFEGTIEKFTALAILLPVVAGQSGNAGAQALAVTMRALALREISIRHWPKVVLKEINVGFLNGLAVALTTSVGVYFWSQSFGLALVIGSAMVISMVAAGFSGAIIPITLKRLGQDPAQSSSIVLTTVTDVVGFMSFLGIATLLINTL